MSKREFIDRLRAALNGRIPAAQVEDTINYYQDYIHVEIRKGKSEEEVLRSLGDPRLIARTIIQTNGAAQEGAYQASGYQDTGYQESGYQDSHYQGSYDAYHSKQRSFRLPGWLVTILIFLILLLILALIFSVLSFLAPVLIVLAAVLFMVKLFGDWLN